MAAGEVVIQSMWSPAVAAVRVKEIPCVDAPVNVKNGKEGYRGWCNGMGLMKHLSGKKLDAAYEYLRAGSDRRTTGVSPDHADAWR